MATGDRSAINFVSSGTDEVRNTVAGLSLPLECRTLAAGTMRRPGGSQCLGSPRLADFLRSLHIAAPEDAPVNHLRSCPLQQRAAAVESRMHRLSRVTDFITPRLIQIWKEALAAPVDMPPTWIHGDLYSRNVLVKRGVVSGIIDWGDMTSGDPATDLACVWSLFSNSSSRDEFFSAYGKVSEVTVKRSKGWAILFGVMLLETGLADNPRNARIGERILHRI